MNSKGMGKTTWPLDHIASHLKVDTFSKTLKTQGIGTGALFIITVLRALEVNPTSVSLLYSHSGSSFTKYNWAASLFGET